MKSIFWVAIFGIIGTSLRYGTDQFFANMNKSFPISTLMINCVGSLLAGSLYAFGDRLGMSSSFQVAWLVGFCGSFTTFSALCLQSFVLIEQGRILTALSYLLLSPILGFIMIFLPIFIVKKF